MEFKSNDLVYKKYKLCNLDKYHVLINYIVVTSISKHTIYRQRRVIDHYIHITNRFVKKKLKIKNKLPQIEKNGTIIFFFLISKKDIY